MLSDGEISYLYDGFGRFEQVTKADGSITHVINGEEKESGELPQESSTIFWRDSITWGQDIITLSLPDLHRKTLITGMDWTCIPTVRTTRFSTMTRQDTVRRRTARTAGKNSSTLMQGQTRIQPDWQPSVTRMQNRNRTYTISTRVRDIMQQMRRSWQTMRLSMARRGQRTMLPTM